MTSQDFSKVQDTPAAPNAARVVEHQVTFRFQLTALNGQPITDESSLYKELTAADENMYRGLPRGITGWSYTDRDDIECERLNIALPEFADDDELPESSRMYDVTVISTRELALYKEQATAEFPLSIEQLMQEGIPLLLTLYAKAGFTLVFHEMRYSKRLEQTQYGKYTVA